MDFSHLMKPHILLLSLVILAGCAPAASPTPTTEPTPGPVTLSQSSLAFAAAGASYAQTVTASETNYSGSFTVSTMTCSGIATVSPSSGTTFTVKPVSAGSCTYAITADNGQEATLTVGVTTTGIGGQ